MGTDGSELVETLPNPSSFKVLERIEFDYVILRMLIIDIVHSVLLKLVLFGWIHFLLKKYKPFPQSITELYFSN